MALVLDETHGERLRREVERSLGAGEAERHFRLPRAEGLHLTLYFLGAVERGRLSRVEAGLRLFLEGVPRPRLRLARSGAFPAKGRERVLWLGVEEREPLGRLAACRGAVLAALKQAGFDTSADEREPFHPHVTVARPRARRVRVPGEFYELALEEDWDPFEVALLESSVGPGGPGGQGGQGQGPARYRDLARFSLRDG